MGEYSELNYKNTLINADAGHVNWLAIRFNFFLIKAHQQGECLLWAQKPELYMLELASRDVCEMTMFWLDLLNTLFRQLLACANAQVCIGTRWHQLVLKTVSHLLHELDPYNSHTTAASLTQPSSDIAQCIYLCTWCLLHIPSDYDLCSDQWDRDWEEDTSPLWPSVLLASASCRTVTCRGAVSFHASPPPDGQQVPRGPLDGVCMRCAKCPPAAWQAAQGPASETNIVVSKEPFIVFHQLSCVKNASSACGTLQEAAALQITAQTMFRKKCH